jgi:glucokinase
MQAMNDELQGFPRLLGDIGGTHARWAWQPDASQGPLDVGVYRCNDDPSIHASAARYLAARSLPSPKWVGIGVATAVTGDRVVMTNHPWSFSARALGDSLGAQRCLVVNDFTALALSVAALGAHDRLPLGAGEAVEGCAIAVLGPGTGLGVSGLVPDRRGNWLPLSGEGGHATLAAADDEDARLLACLRRRYGHASAERVLSGPGLVSLYGAVCDVAGCAPRALEPRDISENALNSTDEQCVETVRRFTGFLGGFAGNLALTLGARGGVYLGGGVVPRLGRAFEVDLFRQRFESKGRFTAYLRAIPTWLITAAHPALVGASRALDQSTA